MLLHGKGAGFFRAGTGSILAALLFCASPAIAWGAAPASDTVLVTPLTEDGGRAASAPAPAPAQTAETNTRRRADKSQATVLAYLVELARRESNPCASVRKQSDLPPLAFSEPLCGVAEDVAARRGSLVGRVTARGVAATRARALAATGATPREALADLRANSCAALIEPYTHIGAVQNGSQWLIVLASLTGKPLPDGETVHDDGAAPMPVVSTGAQPQDALPDSETMTDTELLLLARLNEHRAAGGMCSGMAMPAVGKVEKQTLLQRTARDRAEMRSTAMHPGSKADVDAYAGNRVREFVLKTNGDVNAVLEVWLSNPVRCEQLFDPVLKDAGIGYTDGHWVMLLGGSDAKAKKTTRRRPRKNMKIR